MNLHRATAEIAAYLFVVTIAAVTMVMVMFSGSGVAAAQDGGNVTQQQPGEYIDQNTQLINAELDRDTEEATVTLQSSAVQSIDIYDPAGYWTEGEPAYRTIRVYPGERVNVTLPLEELERNYAVVIETDETIHPEILHKPTQNLDFLEALTPQEAVGTGAIAAFSWFLISGVYVLWIEGGEPEEA